MNRFDRHDKLLALVACAADRKIQSKKKIHKLVYLLQKLGEDFDQDFVFHHYGVFSPSLARELESAERNKRVSIAEPTPDKWGYTIRLVDGAEGISEELLSKGAKDALALLEACEPQLLEVLSTIVYLDRSFFAGQELRDKLQELKPDLAKHYDEAFKLAAGLYEIRT
ncbi:MAG: hypothetical protein KAV00_15005 [Phycisphaerae bacterium]|nr:hypothetical protein [Phycisphaerae bacterium]